MRDSTVKRLRPILLLFALAVAGVAGAQDEKREQADGLDGLALASLMIRDGHYDRAAAVLREVDVEREGLDKARYFTLRGLVNLKTGTLEQAKDDFLAAIEQGQEERIVYVYLAQAYFQLQDYQQTLDALDRAGEAAREIASLYLMRAEAHWNMEQRSAAWRALEEGGARFPDRHDFLRRKVFYLIELGVYQQAATLGREYLSVSEGGEEDYLAIGSALRRGGQLDEALVFLETARLRFPASERVTVELAHVYLDRDELIAAANLFEQAAAHNAELISEAAELHRRAKQLYRALNLNARVRDQEKKLKQRLAILLELPRYQMVAGMEDGLHRVGLLEDENIRYALAYALFKSGDYALAEDYLARIEDGDLFRRAVELRRIMDDCRTAPWQCY